MNIKPLQKSDYKNWLPLWTANCLNKIDQTVTNNTWQRICDPDDTGMNGFGAFDEGATLLGIVHYIIHPTTGSLEPACYMQDLFTDPDHREKGVARALVNRLALEHKIQNWARLYWLAEGDNEAAQALYRDLGLKLNFTFHVMP